MSAKFPSRTKQIPNNSFNLVTKAVKIHNNFERVKTKRGKFDGDIRSCFRPI